MNKKIFILTILFAAVLILAVIVLIGDNNAGINNNTDQGKASREPIILFYGEGCPHCAIVDKYLEDNNIGDKISFEKEEVFYNKNNADELAKKAKICGLPTDSIGVPFLWDVKKCYIGDKEVINFFNQKINNPLIK